MGPINNIPPLVKTIAWRRPGDKQLSKHGLVDPPSIFNPIAHIAYTYFLSPLEIHRVRNNSNHYTTRYFDGSGHKLP